MHTYAYAGKPAEIVVSPKGSDLNEGTPESPLATIAYAQRKAREMRRVKDPAAADGIRIVLEGGVYYLTEPLLVRPEDSGSADAPTVFAAVPGELPVISGGVRVRGWSRADVNGGESMVLSRLPQEARGNVWVADAPRVATRRVEFRQMWVNGRKADRARDRYGEEMNELLVWDTDKREAWIPVPEGGVWEEDPAPLEMVVHQMWTIAILRVKSLDVVGERARVTFHDPESRIQFEKPWPFVWMRGEGNDSVYYLSNSIRLLNRPGEWYQEPDTGKIYYWPLEGEDLEAAEAVVPYMETLVQVAGTPDNPVSHVHFSGIQFSHTTWMRPSLAGHVPLQAGFYMYDAYSLRPNRGTPHKPQLDNQAWVGRKPAAVEASGLLHGRFERCFFMHLGASGLDLVSATGGNVIEGNVFRDIAGSGIVIGDFQEEGVETHLPFNPADERVICQNERVVNNLIVDTANEDWGCVAILAGFVRDVEIAHNEIHDISYTGISLGWGWFPTLSAMRNNHVTANHIHHFGKHMYDTAAIYTLSAQPDSTITRNSLHSIYRPSYVHDPHHWSYIYLDEGSAYFTIEDNWTEGVKFSTNNNGPDNVWKNAGPHAGDEIRSNAGLQPAFLDLLRHATVPVIGD